MTERWGMLGEKKNVEKGMNEKDGGVTLDLENEKSPKTRAISTKKGLDSALLLC